MSFAQLLAITNTVSQKRKSGSTVTPDAPPKRGRFSSILDTFKAPTSTATTRKLTKTSPAAAAAPKSPPTCTLFLQNASAGRVLDAFTIDLTEPSKTMKTHFPSQSSSSSSSTIDTIDDSSLVCRPNTLPSRRTRAKTKTNVDGLFKGSEQHRRRRCSSGVSVNTLSELATRNPELGIIMHRERTPHMVEEPPRLVTIRRPDPKLVAAVRRSVVAASTSSTQNRDGLLEQDLVLARRLGVYLDEHEWREQPSVFSMDEDECGDDEEYAMEVDNSNAFPAPKPRSYSQPSPSISPVSTLERTLSLDQLVATLTLKHREKAGARKGLDSVGKGKPRRLSGLKVELEL